jgi:uncharacterized membrane protein YhaH (DUF805 family)
MTWGAGLAFSLLALVSPRTTSAQFVNPLGEITLQEFLLAVLNAVIYIVTPVIILMIVYTGFLFIAAQGNPQKLSDARRALIWTIIGALIVLGSIALAMAIEATVAQITV